VLGLVALGIFFVRSRTNWDRFVGAVDDTSGIVVTEVARSGGTRTVRGLRDPLSDDPVPLITQHGYDADAVRFEFEPFRALTPEMVARRAAQSLNAPETASFTFEDRTLYASGSAGHLWIEEARVRAAQLEDIQDYNDAALVDSDINRIQEIGEEMVGIPVRFEASEVDPIQDLSLDRIAQLATAGLDVGREAGLSVIIVVRGFSSPDGQTVVNEQLELARAQVAADALVKLGVPTERIVTDRGGVAQPEARAILRIVE
jgi:OOP family OmpA-OmpF porin